MESPLLRLRVPLMFRWYQTINQLPPENVYLAIAYETNDGYEMGLFREGKFYDTEGKELETRPKYWGIIPSLVAGPDWPQDTIGTNNA